MSRWSEEFKKHTIHLTLADAMKCLEKDSDDIDAEFVDEKRRLNKVLVGLKTNLQRLDAESFPMRHLTEINDSLEEVIFLECACFCGFCFLTLQI